MVNLLMELSLKVRLTGDLTWTEIRHKNIKDWSLNIKESVNKGIWKSGIIWYINRSVQIGLGSFV